jgi:hypothetical protein
MVQVRQQPPRAGARSLRTCRSRPAARSENNMISRDAGFDIGVALGSPLAFEGAKTGSR